MIIINKPYYKCEHCKKVYLVAPPCIKHEDNCSRNPKNLNACDDCKFRKFKEITIQIDNYPEPIERESHTFHCAITEQTMYPFNAKKWAKKYEEHFEGQIQMPNKCSEFKEASIFDIINQNE